MLYLFLAPITLFYFALIGVLGYRIIARYMARRRAYRRHGVASLVRAAQRRACERVTITRRSTADFFQPPILQ